MLASSKLIQQLQILSADEFRELEKWLKSPWCNSNKTLVKYYQILRSHHPTFDSKRLTKEKVFKKIYPGKIFNAPMLYNLNSAFLNQVENFLVHEQVRNKDFPSKFYLAKSLLEHNQLKLFKSKAEELTGQLNQTADKGLEDFFQLILLHEYLFHMPDVKEDRKSAYQALDQFDDCLNQFYLLGKSRFFREVVEGDREFEKYDINEQLIYLEKLHTASPSVAFKTYRAYFKMQNQPPKQRFAKLKKIILENFRRLHEIDQKNLLILLINENARLLRTEGRRTALFQEAFELYKIGLDHDLLFYNGYLPVATFANIVSISNFLKKAEFSKDFIEKYAPQLDYGIRDDLYRWARVHLAFHTGDPELWKWAKELMQAESSRNIFAIRTRILFIQIWMEDYIKGEAKFPFVIRLCRSFERQLNRTEFLPDVHLDPFKAFVQYVKKLIQTIDKYDLDREKILNLEDLIHTERNLHGKIWLLQKIEEIKADSASYD